MPGRDQITGANGDAGRAARPARRRRDGRGSTPLQSPLRWALLGLLIEQPSHGYDLAKRFDYDYAGLIELSDPSYIYRSLAALEERGLIEALPECECEAQGRGARRTPYRATHRGIGAFADHLAAEMMRVELSGRVFFRKLSVLAGSSPAHALALIDEAERACLAQRDSPPRAREGLREQGASGALEDSLHAQARTLLLGAALRWLHFTRAQIEAGADALPGRREGSDGPA